jgi:hypothetical protein
MSRLRGPLWAAVAAFRRDAEADPARVACGRCAAAPATATGSWSSDARALGFYVAGGRGVPPATFTLARAEGRPPPA